MSTPDAAAREVRREGRLRTGSGLMSLAALGFVGYAAVFLALNFSSRSLELGIGREQVNVDRAEIRTFSSDLDHYISHLHIALAGFIAATGIAVVALSWFGVRRGLFWAWVAAVAAPLVALGVSVPAHYTWGFATIAHLGPAYLLATVFVLGAALRSGDA